MAAIHSGRAILFTMLGNNRISSRTDTNAKHAQHRLAKSSHVPARQLRQISMRRPSRSLRVSSWSWWELGQTRAVESAVKRSFLGAQRCLKQLPRFLAFSWSMTTRMPQLHWQCFCGRPDMKLKRLLISERHCKRQRSSLQKRASLTLICRAWMDTNLPDVCAR